MAGSQKDRLPIPAEALAKQFQQSGYKVLSTSTCQNRYLRLLDMCRTIVLHQKEIDLLILSVYVGQSLIVEDIVSFLGMLIHKPVIMVLHNGLTPTFISLFPGWTQRVFNRARALVAPSAFLPRALRPYGFTVQVIPNLLEVGDYSFRLRSKVTPALLWMRSFYPYYNPQMGLRVVARLSKMYPSILMTMAGKDKGLQGALIRQAREAGISGNVDFPGYLGNEKKMEAFNQADIFINTNSVDNAPVSIVEAWAKGLPVVSTAVGGIADLIQDGETGLLVPEDDDEAMAGAIQRLVETPQLAEKLSRQGREQAQRFSWEVIQPQWEAVFEEALNGPAARKV
jgi:L-malate glycosyltransferase